MKLALGGRLLAGLVLAVCVYQALAGALLQPAPEQVASQGPLDDLDQQRQREQAANREHQQYQQQPELRESWNPNFRVGDSLHELWESMGPGPAGDRDKYQLIKSLGQVSAEADKCNRSALANLNSLAAVSAHLFSDSVRDYASFLRTRQFKLCKGPAIKALRTLLHPPMSNHIVQAAGAGEQEQELELALLVNIVELGDRVRRQGKRLFGASETQKALFQYLRDKQLEPWPLSGAHHDTYQTTMDQLLEHLCRVSQGPRVLGVLDVLDELHADHSLTWDEFRADEISFMVGSIACRDILEDKPAYASHLYAMWARQGVRALGPPLTL